MDPDAIDAARQLRTYLADACQPGPTETPERNVDRLDGWYAEPPGGPTVGRAPWIYMSDVDVVVESHAVILTFRWIRSSHVNTPTFLVPLGIHGLSADGQAERWITLLDKAFDARDWPKDAIPISRDTSLIVLRGQARTGVRSEGDPP